MDDLNKCSRHDRDLDEHGECDHCRREAWEKARLEGLSPELPIPVALEKGLT